MLLQINNQHRATFSKGGAMVSLQKRYTVLIISREPQSVGPLVALLKGRGHIVCFARSERETIKTLQSCRVDMLFLDIDMIDDPVIDFISIIRNMDRNIAIITLGSVYDTEGGDLEPRLRAQGVLACRGKPLGELEAGWLVESVERYMERQRKKAVM